MLNYLLIVFFNFIYNFSWKQKQRRVFCVYFPGIQTDCCYVIHVCFVYIFPVFRLIVVTLFRSAGGPGGPPRPESNKRLQQTQAQVDEVGRTLRYF